MGGIFLGHPVYSNTGKYILVEADNISLTEGRDDTEAKNLQFTTVNLTVFGVPLHGSHIA